MGDQEFKVILDYVKSLTSSWTTQDSVSKKGFDRVDYIYGHLLFFLCYSFYKTDSRGKNVECGL